MLTLIISILLYAIGVFVTYHIVMTIREITTSNDDDDRFVTNLLSAISWLGLIVLVYAILKDKYDINKKFKS
jgi:Trk-type K+ transport system membrane component